jgi:hypothetical protein
MRNEGSREDDKCLVHCEKRFVVFPSPAGMSLTKLSLAGNNRFVVFPSPAGMSLTKLSLAGKILIIPGGQGECG